MIRVFAKAEIGFKNLWTFYCPRCRSCIQFTAHKRSFFHTCPDCHKQFAVALDQAVAA